MKILLLNDNPVVNKLVTLSAQKTSDELDVVDSIESIQEGEYDLLVVDDTMYSDDMFSKIKSKIMFGASLYICSRDAAEVKAFSSTLKKPFLPTDLVDLFLKFSKEVNMSSLSQEETPAELEELEEFDSQEIKLEEVTEPAELDVFDTEDIDLSLDDELGDLDDELLLKDDELLLDDDLSLDEELSLGDEEPDEELSIGDDDIEDGESILDDEEAQKVKDLLDETSDDEETQKLPEYEPQFAANELGLPVEEIEEFIQDFINQAYDFKDELYASLGNNDVENVKSLSHKIKGVAANLRMQEALDTISVVNTSSDSAEIETSLDAFYKVVDRLAGINTSSSSEEETTDLDELEEFNTEELELEDELELDEELTLDEEPELDELELDEDELENEFTFDEEEAEAAIDKAVTEELALEKEELEPNEDPETEEEETTELDELEEFNTEELELEEDEAPELNEFTFDEEEAESEIDKAVTGELALELDEEETTELDELEEFNTEELELDDELELENEFTFDEEEAESAIDKAVTEELALEEPNEELDLETQIENAVEELSDEDLESELDEETLLEIATDELDSTDAFDSLTSNDLKLAIGEEVSTQEPELSSDDTELDQLEELNQEVITSEETEVQANSIEALENLLAALKDKNVVASLKGTKININITIGDE